MSVGELLKVVRVVQVLVSSGHLVSEVILVNPLFLHMIRLHIYMVSALTAEFPLDTCYFGVDVDVLARTLPTHNLFD